jgi:23S rRNA (guanosine2251-2'-O)-methyltransferase
MEEKNSNLIYGINPVTEALNKQSKFQKIVVEDGKNNPRLQKIIDTAREQSVKVEFLNGKLFSKKFGKYSPQSVVGFRSAKKCLSLEELISQSKELDTAPILVALDEVQDPHNMGAIIRSAEVMGIGGLIVPSRRSAPLNETVAKCSSGALESLRIAEVVNMARALEDLKEGGFWIGGVDLDGETAVYQHNFDQPTVVVFGGEGKGVRPLVKKSFDFSLTIPMKHSDNSLNVSNACAIVFYEILRQKRLSS